MGLTLKSLNQTGAYFNGTHSMKNTTKSRVTKSRVQRYQTILIGWTCRAHTKFVSYLRYFYRFPRVQDVMSVMFSTICVVKLAATLVIRGYINAIYKRHIRFRDSSGRTTEYKKPGIHCIGINTLGFIVNV